MQSDARDAQPQGQRKETTGHAEAEAEVDILGRKGNPNDELETVRTLKDLGGPKVATPCGYRPGVHEPPRDLDSVDVLYYTVGPQDLLFLTAVMASNSQHCFAFKILVDGRDLQCRVLVRADSRNDKAVNHRMAVLVPVYPQQGRHDVKREDILDRLREIGFTCNGEAPREHRIWSIAHTTIGGFIRNWLGVQ